MPSRSIAKVAASLAARLSRNLSGSQTDRSPKRRPSRSRNSADHRAQPSEAAVKEAPHSVATNDTLFWESLRALMVMRIGRGARDLEAVRSEIGFCYQQHRNKSLDTPDREAWRHLAERWEKLDSDRDACSAVKETAD